MMTACNIEKLWKDGVYVLLMETEASRRDGIVAKLI